MNNLPPSSVLSRDQVIGGCRIIEAIGAGGMGQVYLAWHLALHKNVAVKILPPSAAGEDGVSRFLREARACSRVEHPNVVTVHDVGEENGLFYIIMQRIVGKNLSQLVQAQGAPLSWKAAALIIRQAAKGLGAAHRNGIIHRDIKPGNIMLANDGRVVLMDFGLVRDESDGDRTRMSKIVGTPSYMSPEQCTGKTLDQRTDIFSLGSTFYFLLTGRHPYRGTSLEALHAIGSGQKPPSISSINPAVPQDIIEIIAYAMAFEKQKRFPTSQAIAKRLSDAIRKDRPKIELPETEEYKPQPASPELIPELIPLIDASLHTTTEHFRVDPILSKTAIALFGLLLIGLAFNLLIGHFTHDATSEVGDTTGMIFIPAGPVQLGNARARVLPVVSEAITANPAAVEALGITEAQVEKAREAVIERTLQQVCTPPTTQHVKGFWVDQYEVTNAAYAEFVKATQARPPEHWNGDWPPSEIEDHPVVNVSYEDANQYASWAGKKLPTDAQWTRAFRGAERSLFPWGDERQIAYANVQENSRFPETSPITSTPNDRSQSDVYNLVGNVSEFIRSEGSSTVRYKGGNFVHSDFQAIGGFSFILPSRRLGAFGLGFRCVVEASGD